MNEAKATILGHLAGDGNISTNSSRICYVNQSKKCVENFVRLLKKEYNLKNSMRLRKPKGTTIWWLGVSSLKLHNKIIKEFDNKPLHHECRIPKSIKNSNKEIKIAFLQALYSDDGSILFYKRQYIQGQIEKPRITISLTSQKLIQDISKILTELGIKNHTTIQPHFKRYGCRTQYRIDLEKPQQIINFYKLIGFNNYALHKSGKKKKELLKKAHNICVKIIKQREQRKQLYKTALTRYYKEKQSMYRIYIDMKLPRFTVESWIKGTRKVDHKIWKAFDVSNN